MDLAIKSGLTQGQVDNYHTWREVAGRINLRTPAKYELGRKVQSYDQSELSHDELVGWDIGDQE